MSHNVACEQCGKDYEPTIFLKGLCPVCLFSQALPDGGPVSDSKQKTDDSSRVRFIPPKIQELSPHFPELDILELAGLGGMSAVYKAHQPHLNRMVALKLLPKEIAKSQGGSERFLREAQTLAQLSHPNIVNVFDAGETGPWCYIVMEYVAGPNLRQLLGESNLPSSDVLRIVSEICDGLQHAHDQGIVHRDVKPENVLLDSTGCVKIVDFGLAKLLNPHLSQGVTTRTGQVMGTPHYLAPEQIETPTKVDHRADVYSLGVMMYEMLAGELPLGHFESPSRKIGSDPALDAVVLRAMSNDPRQRYQRVRDFQTGMASIGASNPKAGTVERRSPWIRRMVNELFLSACSVLAVLFGCLNLVKATHDRSEAVSHTAFALLAFLTSFIFARVNLSSATCWREISLAQSLCVPVLMITYAVLGSVLLLGPGLAVVLCGSFPLFVDLDHWSAFGKVFAELDRSSMLTPYWLRIYGVSALLSATWSILIAFLIRTHPSLGRLFHLLNDSTASTMTITATLFAAAILAPVGCLLLYAS